MHLDVAAAGEAAQVEVAAGVGQGALVSPPERQSRGSFIS